MAIPARFQCGKKMFGQQDTGQSVDLNVLAEELDIEFPNFLFRPLITRMENSDRINKNIDLLDVL